ncbi:FecCD family ABC transporter permease [Anaerovorax odorimutans]|uniref:FecCD family ABC transporter permease n=1 Tax=Anaerovorax odorimutans TaxID=109327 RepID=UPI000400AFEE|nr:iron ABC transporter permease [Anaerovorax odorimutans]
MVHNERKNKTLIIILFFVTAFLAVISMLYGRYHVSCQELINYFIGVNVDTSVNSAIGNVRLPRVLAALIVGSALSMSGASYQGVFRNPMVSPDLLGASAGAGFGAALGILLEFSPFGIQSVSFLFGLAAVGLSWLISNSIGRNNNIILVLILSGMVISALFQAFISGIKYLADPYSKLPEITFWLMGSLSTITMSDLFFALPFVILSATILFLLRWRLNVLVFGDDEAVSLGINTKKLRLIIIVCATLLTASVVSISGQVGWVGLVIPHFCRMIVGPNYKYLIPASLFVGGSYLLLVDNIARNFLTVEIPLGILTAVIGAPVFVFLLLKGRKEWC